jgi:hypothetical protein
MNYYLYRLVGAVPVSSDQLMIQAKKNTQSYIEDISLRQRKMILAAIPK